jgi:outer membrane protein assembly factor BamB
MVIAEMDKKIVGLAVRDGKQLWETPFVVPGRGYNASTPMVAGNTLIYGGSGRPLTAVQIVKEGDAFVAKPLWQNAEATLQFNTPVVKDGALFGLTANNEFFALTKDGQLAWSVPAAGQTVAPANPVPATQANQGLGGGPGRRGGGGGRGGYGQIVDAGSVLIALTPASELVVFEPSTKAYTELARIKVSSSPTYAYPVVSGKRIFVKDKDDVMLFTVE